MFAFFDWVVDFVGGSLNFVFQILKGFVRLLQIIPVAAGVLTDSLGYLPSFLAAFAGATITVSIVFLIAGRQGGGDK